MRNHFDHLVRAGVAVALAVAVASPATAQTTFLKGQSVQPVYEGYERNPDGSFDMVFGYFNRNYQEEPHIAVGPDNFFEPGPQDRGQPTHFDTRRQNFIFKVRVPADWGKKDLVWTLKSGGRTLTAIGTLLPSWVIDEGVYRANRGAGISGNDPDSYNSDKPPSISISGPTTVKARVGQPVSVTAIATDDGKPGPRPKAPPRPSGEGGGAPKVILSNPDLPAFGGDHSNAASGTGGPTDQNVVKPRTAYETGLAVTWRHYRGAGSVTFSPREMPVRSDGKATTELRFSAPGTYVIRAVADDSTYTTGADITVEVSP